MIQKEFISNGNNIKLIAKRNGNKKELLLEIEGDFNKKDFVFDFYFAKETMKELKNHLSTISKDIWGEIKPKEAYSEASDYYEYYDKELETNGYISIYKGFLKIERPSFDSNRLYVFNKKKIESFIYDLEKIIRKGED